MSPGPFSVIHIDILELSGAEGAGLPLRPNMKPLNDGKSMSAIWDSLTHLRASNLGCTRGVVEIANCLNSTLKNRSGFFSILALNNNIPGEIRPFHRESFFAPYPTIVEATLCYEIESTDLCLLISIRIEAGNNSFVAAFAPIPAEENMEQLVALMQPNGWTTHLYRKQAQAGDGEQVIQMRNIRASGKMTDDADSFLKIRVFTV
jgi:hypothetical protein